MDAKMVTEVLQEMIDDIDKHIRKLCLQREAVQRALDDFRR